MDNFSLFLEIFVLGRISGPRLDVHWPDIRLISYPANFYLLLEIFCPNPNIRKRITSRVRPDIQPGRV